MEKAILVKRINTAREERGICQQKAVGVVHAANRIAQKKPGLPVFIESCRQLKVSPNYLLTDYLKDDAYHDTSEMMKLLRTATPGKTKIIMAMSKSALLTTQEDEEPI